MSRGAAISSLGSWRIVRRACFACPEAAMPRYLVLRTFPDGLHVPTTADGAASCERIGDHNMEERVTWITSFVATDKRTAFCLYEGPSPEAIRRAAQRNGWPVDRITEVRVLDPAFYY
jgi:hypothetical protein